MIESNNSTKSNNLLPIGKYVRETLDNLINDNLIDNIEIENLLRADYSKKTFDIQFPFLKEVFNHSDSLKVRYWKNSIKINGKSYYVCSQWYEVSANNDRPYYDRWLKKMKNQ